MIVCPQCQFQNPDPNNFCQQCGTSLVQASSSSRPVGSADTIDQADYPVEVYWWGIVTQTIADAGQQNAFGSTGSAFGADPASTPEQLAEEQSAKDQVESTVNPEASRKSNPEAGDYLDAEQRYQWVEPPLAEKHELQGRVQDHCPLQLSPLVALTAELPEYAQSIDVTNPNAITAHLQKIANELAAGSKLSLPHLPETVYIYLGLNLQFPYVVPQLHDAWQDLDRSNQVLLVSDRSQLKPLAQSWQDRSLPPAQLLRWLDEMTDLWGALEPWGCCASLLEERNLWVDQGQFLCLQYLHQSPIAAQPKDLGALWQSLFATSDPTHQQAFAILLAGLETEQIEGIDRLQALLSEVAIQLSGVEPGIDQLQNLSLEDELDISLMSSPELASSISTDVPTVILPNQLVGLEAFGYTDKGQDRDHNEDYFLIHHRLEQQVTPLGKQVQAEGIYILCDGMGGHAQGEVASSLAAHTLYEYFKTHWLGQGSDPEPLMAEAIFAANKTLFTSNEGNARSGSGRMGTTLVLVLVQNTQVWIAHVGDSRLYRITHHRELEQITVDHEVGQRDISRGVEPEVAYARPDAYQLTQALGPRDQQFIRPEIQSFEVDEDSILLLCSDGLTDNDLLEKHSTSHLQPLLNPATNLEQGGKQLIDLANQHNGHDNITIVAIRLGVRSQLSLFA
ncbi:MAG: serine/threonine phosphatase [Aphanocapsa sp. GSE-SYN-MK-11-07L]|jgi:protein phosphatase|nr:serine/threonine phosphatase [Aphanocapsa sp. GSE-SYN-MK-11-07L]